MRWDNLYVAGIGTYLPEKTETVDEAIAAGRYTEEKKAMNGYRAVRIAAPEETGPVMAAKAGRKAVARSGIPTDEFGVVVHTYIGHQGFDFWTPASYVQRETIGGDAPAFEVRQGCNGFVAGLELGASFIAQRPDVSAALITGGDSFRLPYVDRWGSHEQNVDGDGGGAIVLSTRSGFARVRATYSFGDSQLEPMARTSATWTDTPFPGGRTLSLDTSLKDYMRNEQVNLDEVVERISNGVKHSVTQVLKEVETELSQIRFFLHQQLAETIAVYGIYELLGVDRATTTFDWGKDYGMVGTIDLVMALDHVIAEREPKPGDLVLLQGAGAGYVWTTAVLEFWKHPTGPTRARNPRGRLRRARCRLPLGSGNEVEKGSLGQGGDFRGTKGVHVRDGAQAEQAEENVGCRAAGVLQYGVAGEQSGSHDPAGDHGVYATNDVRRVVEGHGGALTGVPSDRRDG